MSAHRRSLAGALAAVGALACAVIPAAAQQPSSSSPQTTPDGAPAVEVIRDAFPALLGVMQDTGAPRLTAVTPDGTAGRASRGRYVVSTAPLTADGQPVQRALRVQGDAAQPINPVVDATLPLDPSDPHTVGSGPRRFAVVPLGADDGDHRVVGDGVLHTATHTQTDTVARAITGGIETYEVIRGAEAPQRFAYRIDGARPELDDDGTIALYDGSQIIGRVAAPLIIDASGRDMPGHLTVDGTTVVFHVEHRTSGTEYPVLADPTWVSDYDYTDPAQGRGGIKYENPTGAYSVAAQSGGSFPGITVRPNGGRVYQPEEYGEAVFWAPVGSRIDKVQFVNVFRRNDGERQTARLGLYGPNWSDVDDYFTVGVGRFDPTVTLDDPTDQAQWAIVRLGTPPCEPGESNCPRLVASNSQSRITVERMIVTLVDSGAPAVSWTGSLPGLAGPWIKAEGSQTLGVAASDNGSGVLNVTASQVWGGGKQAPPLLTPSDSLIVCTDLHPISQEAYPCPESVSYEKTLDLAQLREGRVQIVADAEDYAGNTAADVAPFLLRLDRSAPDAPALRGSLVAGAENRWQQLRATEVVEVDAKDRYSGVKHVDLSVTSIDPAGVNDAQTLDVPCTPSDQDQPCPTETTLGADVDGAAFPDGTLEVRATATDFVGYTGDAVVRRLYKDNAPAAASANGELTRLEGQWTGSTGDASVSVTGKDRRSGVASMELYARDEAGLRLLEEFEVCDPTTKDASIGEACPLTATRSATVDLGDLESGRVTLEAYATDAAGNRDPSPESWNTYVDHDPPPAVGRITSIRPKNGPLRVSWTPAVDEDSGIDGYEYSLVADENDANIEWVKTKTPGVTIPAELEKPIILVRAVDKAGNRGQVKAARLSILPFTDWLKFACAVGPSLVGWLSDDKNEKTSLESKMRAICSIATQRLDELNGQALAMLAGALCGEAGICSLIPGRNSPAWLVGEIAAGFFLYGDIRDFVVAVFNGKSGDAALAVAGLVPFAGDAAKSFDAIRTFMKRTGMKRATALKLVRKLMGDSDLAAGVAFRLFGGSDAKPKHIIDELTKIFGDGNVTRKVLDRHTSGAYSKLRNVDAAADMGGLSHDGVSQLIKSGNDIAALVRRAAVRKMDLTDHDKKVIADRLKTRWGSPTGNKWTEAMGVECAIRTLEKEGDHIRILVDGRPNTALSRYGPDIVAYDSRRNRLIVVEAKSTSSKNNPLTLRKLQSKIQGVTRVQPSVRWLFAPRDGSHDYLSKMERSADPEHQLAAKMLRQLEGEERKNVDLRVVQARPATPGSRAYGSGVDAAARLMREEGRGKVDDIQFIDVPF